MRLDDIHVLFNAGPTRAVYEMVAEVLLSCSDIQTDLRKLAAHTPGFTFCAKWDDSVGKSCSAC